MVDDKDTALDGCDPVDAATFPLYSQIRTLEAQIAGLRPEVLVFANLMEHKLREHDADRGDSWRQMSPQALFDRLCAEMEELKWAWERDEKRVECIDVANFAMFLWNRLPGDET